jgi:hypothetical protein
MLAATSGLPGRRPDFLVQCQAKARRCQRRTVSGCTISRHRRQPDQNRYNTTHKSRSHRWRRKRRGAFFWQTASWWRSARISACRAARVRKTGGYNLLRPGRAHSFWCMRSTRFRTLSASWATSPFPWMSKSIAQSPAAARSTASFRFNSGFTT